MIKAKRINRGSKTGRQEASRVQEHTQHAAFRGWSQSHRSRSEDWKKREPISIMVSKPPRRFLSSTNSPAYSKVHKRRFEAYLLHLFFIFLFIACNVCMASSGGGQTSFINTPNADKQIYFKPICRFWLSRGRNPRLWAKPQKQNGNTLNGPQAWPICDVRRRCHYYFRKLDPREVSCTTFFFFPFFLYLPQTRLPRQRGQCCSRRTRRACSADCKHDLCSTQHPQTAFPAPPSRAPLPRSRRTRTRWYGGYTPRVQVRLQVRTIYNENTERHTITNLPL